MCVSELPTEVKVGEKNRKVKDITIGFLVRFLTKILSRDASHWSPSQAVQPSTGNMVYDEFQDSTDTLSELETRLSHMRPVEVLYRAGCSSRRLQRVLEDWKLHSGR